MSTSSRSSLALALACASCCCAHDAGAVNLNPNGTGQVLIYPYYTVNVGQQTQVSVVNTTLVGKVVKVRFREAYNGRAVLDFNLYLSPYDVWTANVFALSDAGVAGDFAGLFTLDTSCTDPPLNGSGSLVNGAGYLRFTNANYTGAAADTGPSSDSRTREGHIEMILMSDVKPGSALDAATKHVNGVPPGCASARVGHEADYSAPTLDPVSGVPGTLADGGLFGAAAIVDVPQGVFYAYNADALDGFSYVSLFSPTGDPQPTLASVNDRDNAQAATSHVFASGESIASTYPGTTSGSRKVDAVSSVFTANNVYNEYATARDQSIGTDWVLTLPTKHLYVDAQPGGAIVGNTAAFAPFELTFGAVGSGTSCIGTDVNHVLSIDREENASIASDCGFSAGCPPAPLVLGLCLETNVLDFSASSVLGSQLPALSRVFVVLGAAGWVNWDLSKPAHQLYPADNGNTFHGLPVTGFAATKFINDFVPRPGGGFAVGNFTAAYHHRSTVVCENPGKPACL